MSAQAKQRLILFKFLSIFSVVRGYNVLLIVFAQYLTSIFILSDKTYFEVLFDEGLFLIICCSSLSIASGYIINNFYDEEKDLINKPVKYKIDDVVNNSTKIRFYFFLNFIVVLIASFISLRAVLFFSVYIFFLWFYSHKIKRLVFIGNLFYSLLTVTPFFAILLYFKNIDLIIIAYALFLFFMLLLKDITKDLKNLKGDFSQDYKTIPVVFGESFTKTIISLIAFINILLLFNLYFNFSMGYMTIFYAVSLILLLVFLIKLFLSKKVPDYLFLHNVLRFIIVFGVFSIIFLGL
jgi:4-hydroxybenzoate polyprenyltransferase